MADNVIDSGQYLQTYPSPTYSEPRSVKKEKTTVTKEFDSKGRVVKEIKVTEIETETFQVTYPYTPTWTSTTGQDIKYGVTTTNISAPLQKAKD
jgi:hypothetical protein